ncbi:MAG: diguanylate cyclase [Spirochaetota bacterium]|nr:diguanylate cyclase [Spirochaetota bacterium]
MGLLEKVQEYKKSINSEGKETLIDRIQGPAETEFIVEDTPPSSEINQRNESIPDEEDDLRTDEEMLINKEDADELQFVIDDDEDTTHDSVDYSISQIDDDSDLHDDLFGLPEDDDDLFGLPEDDDNLSPIFVLDKQKENEKSTIGIKEEDRSEYSGDYNERENFKPLGPEDEPVLTDLKDTPIEVEGEDEIKKSYDENILSEDEVPQMIDVEIIEDRNAESAYQELKVLDDAESNEEKYEIPQVEDQEDRVNNLNGEIDYQILYEITKELERAKTLSELFDMLIFNIMGQIGVSSSSIMIPDQNNIEKWIIVFSRGIDVNKDSLTFDSLSRILNQNDKDIIDIEEIIESPDYKDIYYQLISIDSRLLLPLRNNDQVLGTLILGNKLTDLTYTENEKKLLVLLTESSADIINRINTIESIINENTEYKRNKEVQDHIDNLQRKIVSVNSIKRLNEVVDSEFKGMGIESYSVFIKDENEKKYIPVLIEDEDLLQIKETGFSINHQNSFMDYVNELKDSVIIEEIEKSDIIEAVFTDNQIKKISLLWIYPFRIGSNLVGFITIFRLLNRDRDNEIDIKMNKLAGILILNILNIKRSNSNEYRYTDNIELLLKRLNNELSKSDDLNVPLSIIYFSIRNLKRYYNLFGYDEAKKLIESVVKVIKGRLEEADFSFRLSRNKILVVLPGKDKKYAVPLANAIRNEILQGFTKKEMQLLITYLTAEYPEEGSDLYSLLDNIEL